MIFRLTRSDSSVSEMSSREMTCFPASWIRTRPSQIRRANYHRGAGRRPAATSPERSGLVFSRALPVDDIAQSPRILVQIKLQITVLVDDQLSCRIQDASAFALVLIVDVDLACGKVKALGL